MSQNKPQNPEMDRDREQQGGGQRQPGQQQQGGDNRDRRDSQQQGDHRTSQPGRRDEQRR